MARPLEISVKLALGGCLALAPAFAAPAPKPVTFTKDIAPILQDKCEDCHRNGGMAPMPLVTYQQVRPWAKAIKSRVLARTMPPWFIDKTVGIQHFSNDASLSDDQMAMIAKWVDSGSPMGDVKDMPPPKNYTDEDSWKLAKKFGPPDMVLKSADYTMPAHGQDVWFKPLTEVNITEPRWVRAVEIRPSTPAGRRIFHHVLARLLQDETPQTMGNLKLAGGAIDDNAGGGGAASAGLLMEWAVGKNYDIYRPNSGKLILPGSKIWWELHIHAVGEQIRDHAELAVYLYPKGQEPKYRVRLTSFGSFPRATGIDIPPNSTTQTSAYHVLPAAARLENFQPHMHLRGKAMAMEAILPDGTTRVLSYVNNFNFNWMTNYIYADDAAPVLPKGTILHITAWYDNTANNPNNPDPNQWVGFGDRTVDEMGHAWVNVTYMSDEDYKEWAAQHKPKPSRSAPGTQQ
ncbi:MAG TPA: hypothetical protein VMG40_21750 [Bryobacteraceae bacterium]|nr:hypothetical protein [Bryobacteraceae bacterium]